MLAWLRYQNLLKLESTFCLILFYLPVSGCGVCAVAMQCEHEQDECAESVVVVVVAAAAAAHLVIVMMMMMMLRMMLTAAAMTARATRVAYAPLRACICIRPIGVGASVQEGRA